MIDDEEDFKEASKRGVAKKTRNTSAATKSKRSRRQILKDSGAIKGEGDDVAKAMLAVCRFRRGSRS